jgi:glycosyltransferase involved in cell wall biosynthesis
MFDPHSIEDIAEKIWSVWNDAGKRLQMKQASLKRVEMFNWSDTARKTIAVYQNTLS